MFEDLTMFNRVKKAVLLALLVAGSVPTPSSPQGEPNEAAQSEINLTMDDRHILKEYLFKSSIELKHSVMGIEWERGSVVPHHVELRAFPVEVVKKLSQVKAYRFLLTENAIVIISPENRKVVEVIKR
jgi:hypothetical protein